MADYQEYDYRIPRLPTLLGIIGGGLISFLIIITANKTTDFIFGYGVMIMTGWLIILFILSFIKKPNKIILTNNAISFPKNQIGKQIITLAYSDIDKIKITYMNKRSLTGVQYANLYIIANNTQYLIREMYLQSNSDFHHIKTHIEFNTNLSQRKEYSINAF